jgi:ribosome-binding protein aMBF1 (putative translation factor)
MVLDTEFRTMKCERCRKSIEANEIRFAIEGDWMGKPLCRRCKFDVEEESREKYRRGREKEYRKSDLYRTDVYRAEPDE